MNLHFNDVSLGEDGQVILEIDGQKLDPVRYPFPDVLFDLKVPPEEPNVVYAYPKDGSPSIKLTKEACHPPIGSFCYFRQQSPYKRVLSPAAALYEYKSLTRGEYAQVYMALDADPPTAALSIGGRNDDTSLSFTGVVPVSLGPRNPQSFRTLTFSSPALTEIQSLFKTSAEVALVEDLDAVVLIPERGDYHFLEKV
ncbi:hypothetical protein FOZ63_031999 [Perkinsus olseni]|uniref:Uncharacterized protein n=1 Tax=Perkinsus olseni TaxID=32597 RepID=A0A7J6R0F6_PEROL|nr:hypothetical protein FOZ63_031999 [Perkinsus olseni]